MSRRLVSFVLLVTVFSCCCWLMAQPDDTPPKRSSGCVNVLDFGAKGDGRRDDTDAIQRASSSSATTF